MKPTVDLASRRTGNALVISVVTAGILCLLLLSYLGLVYWQNKSVARSQAWNMALTLAESGVEEALAQLNPAALHTNVDRSANGWGTSGSMFGPVTRSLTGGVYGVVISADTFPVIYATGYTKVPALSANLSRTIKVNTTAAPLFGVGMAAHHDITFTGTKLTVDSYDSSDDRYSTGGLYDPAKRKAGGDVASNYGPIGLQNAEVKGKVYSGPTGTYTFNNGTVGDLNWTGPGIQPGWITNDFNVDYPDVIEPFTTATEPPGRVTDDDGTNYMYIVGTGNYKITGDLTMKNTDFILVKGTNAVLYVTGSVSMATKSYIYIRPGASLQIYVAGPSAVFSTVNVPGNANTFQYYGLPTNLNVTWNGNDQYFGAVYAPEAFFQCGGGGSSPYDFQGACVADAIKLNGSFNFHFDENLRRNGPIRGYLASAWQEL